MTLESAYTGSWASALDGAEIPLSAFRDQMLMVEKTFAQEIGSNPQHPARTFLYGRSEDLANGDATPAYDNNGVEFCGIFDSCADSVTLQALTYMPVQTIVDCRNSFFSDTSLLYYNLTGAYIYHTRDNAFLQGCVWDLTTQTEAYDADQSSPLPEYLAAGLVAGVIALSPQVGWTDASNVTAMNQAIYEQAIASCRGAGTNLPLSAQMSTVSG